MFSLSLLMLYRAGKSTPTEELNSSRYHRKLLYCRYESVAARTITSVACISNIRGKLTLCKLEYNMLGTATSNTRVVIRATKLFNLQCTIVVRQTARIYFLYRIWLLVATKLIYTHYFLSTDRKLSVHPSSRGAVSL